MANILLTLYITGALMFLWCAWMFEGEIDLVRAIESVIWPLAIPVATIRTLMDRRRRG